MVGGLHRKTATERRQKAAKAAAAVINGSGSSSSTVQPPCVPFALHMAVSSEMLLLTLELLQQLQLLRKAATGASSSGGRSQGVSGSAAQAEDAAAAVDQSHGSLTGVLLLVAQDTQTAFLQADAQTLQGVLTPEASAAASELHMVFQAGSLCTAFEQFVRAGNSSWPELQRELVPVAIADLCGREWHGLARGGGSEQHLALFRLLVSLLKVSGGCVLPLPGHSIDKVPTAVAQAACSMLKDAAAAGCAGDVGGESDDSQSVLWLLVFGRCCLQWAAALHCVERQGVGYVQVLQQAQREVFDGLGPAMNADGTAVDEGPRRWLFDGRELGSILAEQMQLLTGMAGSLAAGRASTAGSLNRRLLLAGYDSDPIVQGLTTLCASYREVVQLCWEPDDVVVDRMGSFIRALVSLGESLSMFAVRHCCNNPRCGNTSGRSEKALVSGKGCLCAGCKVARYCGKRCQAACWKKTEHRPVCKMLRERCAPAPSPFETFFGFCAAVLGSKSCLDR
jgi:hypothetical protein